MKKFLRFTTNTTVFSTKKQLFNQKNRLLCAVSGGQDSIISFFIFFHIFFQTFHLQSSKNTNFQINNNLICKLNVKMLATFSLFDEKAQVTKFSQLEIIYCQHFWQIKNFFCSEFLFQISFLFEIPYTLILPQKFLTTENRSRGWRKKNFSRFLELRKFSSVVTGSTKSDFFEKNLTNLLRGTSPSSFDQPRLFSYKKPTSLFFSTITCKPHYPQNLSGSSYFKSGTLVNNFRKKSKKNFYIFPKLILQNKIPQAKKCKSRQLKKDFNFSKKKFRKFPLLPSSKNLKGYRNEFQHSLFSFTATLSSSFCFSSKALKNQITFVKPLQKLTRSSVSKALNLFKLPIKTDITNFSTSFYRNKIRHYLIPWIRFLFQNNVESLMTKFLFLVNSEHKEVQSQVIELKIIFKLLRCQRIKKTKLSHGFQQKCQLSSFSRKKDFQNTIRFKQNIWTPIKLTITLQRLLLQQAVTSYLEIELNYRQISLLQTFLCDVCK